MDIEASEAYQRLRDSDKHYLYNVDEHNVVRIVSPKTAALSALCPPFTFKDGLGSIVYLGVSNTRDALERLQTYTQFGIAGAIVETAYGNRNDVIDIVRQVRDRHTDLFLMTGTTTNPEGVVEMLQFADAVKVGIAEGSHCRTSETGVGVPNAWAGMECGQAADGLGTILLDGWGTPREYCLGMSCTSVRGRQSGGAFAARRESAMPLENEKKRFRGMASAPVDLHRTKARGNGTLHREMSDSIHLYWEGAEQTNELRSPSNIGAFLHFCKQRLQSAMSYSSVRTQDATPHLRQFQERSTLYIV